MSDENERSGASAGSVAAWAVVRGDCVDSTFTDRDEAVEWACGLIPPPQIVPLYRQPYDGVVRLPPLDPNGAPGWNAAIGAVREALAEAGVDWDTE